MAKRRVYTVAAIFVVLVGAFVVVGNLVLNRPRTWDDVEREKMLRVVTSYDPINYYLDEGKPMGFGYEVIKGFTDSLGFSLDVTIESSYAKRLSGVENGDFDVMLDLIPITSESDDVFHLTFPLATSKLLLVQMDKMYRSATDSVRFVSDVSELDSARIYIAEGSEYRLVLDNIMDETGIVMDVVEDEYAADMLCDKIVRGEIAYAAVDRLYLSSIIESLPILNADVALGFDQFVGWLTSDVSTQGVINDYIDSMDGDSRFVQTKREYGIR